LEDLGLIPLDFSDADFKQEVYKTLVSTFGAGAVKMDKKCIKLNENIESKCNADVVPAYVYKYYKPKSIWLCNTPSVFAEGIAFYSDTGERFFNYPEQHYQNGVSKNESTNRRYKSLVRILKRLRNHMEENKVPAASPAKSYLLECMLYNCPDSDFSVADLYVVMKEALLTLIGKLGKLETSREFTEVNGIKYLFNDSQKWTLKESLNIAYSAYTYIGFK
jgi:hypothetical protein